MIDYLLNKIHNCDCLEFMKQLPDKCVDLVLTDPPYGIGADKTMHKQGGTQYGKAAAPKKHYANTDWDNSIPSKDIFDEIFRISKNQIIFGGNYFTEFLPNSPCWIVWDKVNGDNGFADCELAFTSFTSAVRKFTYMWNGMLQEDMKNKEKRVHPTQKPIPLIKRLIDKYSQSSDIIFDPFMGSGTTAIASYQLGRQWFGCEISPEYVAIANKRIENEMNNLFEASKC